MTPFNAQVAGLSSAALPQGAIFNANAQTLYWLPQKGQAGTYKITAADGTRITLQVNASAGLEQGPPATYQDGELGFVYVHGMSSENYCLHPVDLATYWGSTSTILSPKPNTGTVACYDGTRSVEDSALIVAQEILSAPCGTYNKCVVVSHSMGNLVMEYILTHSRAAISSDPEPALFAHAALFAQVKSRMLFVISVASAAGGSKAANILNDPLQASFIQGVVGAISDLLSPNTPAAMSLDVQRASTVLAPITADPGIPFFMVPGYTSQTVNEYGAIAALLGDTPSTVYNGDSRYAELDPVVQFHSRSDGMVDFRSACGIASSAVNDGPGYTAPVTSQFQYCLSSSRKPNHFLWFMTSLNHTLIATPWAGCSKSATACVSWFPNATGTTFQLDANFFYKSSIEIIRAKLFP